MRLRSSTHRWARFAPPSRVERPAVPGRHVPVRDVFALALPRVATVRGDLSRPPTARGPDVFGDPTPCGRPVAVRPWLAGPARSARLFELSSWGGLPGLFALAQQFGGLPCLSGLACLWLLGQSSTRAATNRQAGNRQTATPAARKAENLQVRAPSSAGVCRPGSHAQGERKLGFSISGSSSPLTYIQLLPSNVSHYVRHCSNFT